MPGLLDGLFGGGGDTQAMSAGLLDPRAIRQQALFQALTTLGGGLMAAGQRRPAMSPSPLPQALASFGPAYQQGLLSGRQQNQFQRQDQQDQQMQSFIAGRPELAGLPAPIAQAVIQAQLSRAPPDPRQNYVAGYRGGLWNVAAPGGPQYMRAPGAPGGDGGAGGDGSGGGAAAGAAGTTAGPVRGAGLDNQMWNVLLNPNSDPGSPLYSAAWRHHTQPRASMIPIDPENPDAGMRMVEIRPEMPPNIRPPTHMGGGAPAPTQRSPNANLPTVTMAEGAVPGLSPGLTPAPPQSRVTDVPGGVRPAAPTEGQRLVAGFASRMDETERIMSGLERAGFDASNFWDAASGRAGIAGNYAMSAEGQRYRNAAQNWVRANLRRESGAVIQPEEMAEEIRTYFPQPGDRAETIAQKAALRRTTRDALVTGAGAAYRPRSETTSPPPPPPGAAAPQAEAPRALYRDVPRRANGNINTGAVEDGRVYRSPTGAYGRWDAARMGFEAVIWNAQAQRFDPAGGR